MLRPNDIESVVIIGSGNVASHLAVGLHKKKVRVLQVLSVHVAHADELAQKVEAQPITDLKDLDMNADLYILAVPDGKISEVVSQLPVLSGLVVHTSGFTSLNILEKFEHHAVFYPLQTFSKSREIALSAIPFFLEASDDISLQKLTELTHKLSPIAIAMDSQQRKRLHLAAVFVSNFNNYLYLLADEFLQEEGMDLQFLQALITETAAKVSELSPEEAQTGPARRNDGQTLAAHLQLLEGKEEIREFYQLFSKHILQRYHE